MTTIDRHAIAPVDVIALRLTTGDDTALELWRFCANQWLEYGIVDAEDYFDTAVAPVEPEGDPEDDVDGDDIEEVEVELPEEIDPEIKEAIAMNRDYIDALNAFWLEMVIFNSDVDIPQWDMICDVHRRLVKTFPADTERLVENVRRLNKARVEVDALRPKPTVYAPDSTLFSLLNNPGV